MSAGADRAGGPVPPDVVCAYDYERHARQCLSDDIWASVAGGGGDGLTRQWNREASDSLKLSGRVLADMTGASTTTTLFGLPLDCPIMLAPVAYQRLVHRDGEIAAVLGASAVRAWMCVSTLASAPIEEIAQVASTTLLFQLYMLQGREASLRRVRRAEAAGYKALVVTVDAPVNGIRNDEQRAGFSLPDGVAPVNMENRGGPVSRAGPGQSPVFMGLLDGAPTWSDIEWLRGQTKLPLLLKGIVSPADAERAIGLGVDGIVVSNHGGRTLDTLPSSLDALGVIAEKVGDRVPLILDGGVRRGTDVLKALALGAKAVMIGQPLLHALAVAGPVGVVHLLTILRAELETAMALTGCARIADIGPDVLWSDYREARLKGR